MSWHYVQRTGNLYDSHGELAGVGYSGHGPYRNQPAAEGMRGEGPIPRGEWKAGEPIDTKSHGPYVLPLLPQPGTRTYGRAGFLMHGDSIRNPGTASLGCVVQARKTREAFKKSGETLTVVADESDLGKERKK